MPHKYLQLQQEQIAKTLRRNTLISGLCAVTGFCLLIPSFSVEGSKFDYQEFCFKPPSVPARVTWCKGKRLKKGIAWRVALEASTNQEFQTKVKFLKFLPAQNPNAGLYGLCSGAFFLSAFFLFKQGTDDLESNLDLVVANKKAIVFERNLEQEKHLNIQTLKAQQEEEFVKDLMNREHGTAMYELMSDAERELTAQGHHKAKQLDDAGVELQLSTIKAQTAEQEEKEAKHKVEVEKLSKSNSAKSKASRGSIDANEAAKEELIEKLKSHENGWLYTLVMTNKPIFVIGSQGSWKSYGSATIALCRYYLKGQKIASIVDPHFNKNADESWKELIPLEPETYGGAQDWEDVAVGIQEGFNRWNHRTLKDEALTSIWDEQTNWILHDECANSAKEFMGRVISDPRKSNEGVLVITHSFTNAGTGGSSGFAASREEGVLQLRLNADNEMKPLFKGKLIGFKDEDGELIEDMKISIPKDWFNPTAIKKMFEVK
jgi:hypothetical protein